MLWELFITFLMIGLVSFGGGYAMIPLIEMEVTKHDWMTTQQFTDIIAVAGMSPGPIATNSAVFVGYETAGLMGAIASITGMIVPSFIMVVVVSGLFYKVNKSRIIRSAFYGLRPVITGLIFYAAIRFSYSNHLANGISWNLAGLFLIFAASLVALLRFRLHPFYILFGSGIAGVVLYS